MSGFYKINTENDGLHHAPNFVFTESRVKITKDSKDKTQTVDGWKWFDSEIEALTYFNIQMTEQEKSILQAKIALQNAGILEKVVFKDQSISEKWVKADISKESPLVLSLAAEMKIALPTAEVKEIQK